MFVTLDLLTKFLTERIATLMISLSAKFHIPNSMVLWLALKIKSRLNLHISCNGRAVIDKKV